MKELEKQISIVLKELEELIKDKKEIKEKREELDELLRKYLKNLK